MWYISQALEHRNYSNYLVLRLTTDVLLADDREKGVILIL